MAMLDRVKGLFKQGSTPKTRAASADLDLLGPDYMPDGALAAFYELLDSRSPITPRLIQRARQSMVGQLRASMAPAWDEAEDDVDTQGPDQFLIPRKTARRLSTKKSEIKRPSSGLTPRAQEESTEVEQWDNAYLDETFPDFEVTEMTLNEGVTLMLTVPMPSHWQKIPTMWDEFGEESEPISASKYMALPPNRKKEYEVFNPSERGSSQGEVRPGAEQPGSSRLKYYRMKSRYRVNAKGEKDDGSESFTVDHKQSNRFYRDEMADAYARNLPILLRGPISRTDYVPFEVTFSGKRTNLEGVIIRSLYRRSKLRRDYQWDGCNELLEKVDRYDGKDGDFYLYELWAYDEKRRPYVAYQVGSHSTTWSDDQNTTAVVKLWEEYPGLTELPIAFEYGDHTASSNPDHRALPFSIPFIGNWLQRDKIITQLGISIDQSAYPSFGQIITEDSIKARNAAGGDLDLEFRLEPGTIKPLFGTLVELQSKGSNADVKTVFEVLQALNHEDLPQAGAFGGEGPTSGLDRQIISRDTEVAFAGTIEGVRRIKEKCGRDGLMVASAIGKKADRPVCIYAIGEGISPKTGKVVKTWTPIELPYDLCGGIWDVEAIFPHIPGENLAMSSWLLEALAQGAILMREFREVGWGDRDPEQFLVEKALEDYYTKDPAGKLDLLMGMAEQLRDTRMQKLLKLSRDNKITSPQGGVSTDAMGDLLAPGSQQPQPGSVGQTGTGLSLPNPGQQALAGGNAGVIGADAASAGGPMSGMQGVA